MIEAVPSVRRRCHGKESASYGLVEPAFFVGCFLVFLAVFVPGLLVESLSTRFLAPTFGWDWWASAEMHYVPRAALCGAIGWFLFALVWSTVLLLVMGLSCVCRGFYRRYVVALQNAL